MKKYLFVFLQICVLSVVGLAACQSDDLESDNDEILNGVYASEVGLLLDGGEISDISLYCIEDNALPYSQWFEYYPQIKTVNNYVDFKLGVYLNRHANVYKTDDWDEMNAISKLVNEYVKEKSSFIVNAYYNYEDRQYCGWPYLFTAYVNGDISITCDKELFGKAPGTNLNEYFSIKSQAGCVPFGIEDVKMLYDFGDEIPTNMATYFKDGMWLQPKYNLRFAKQPTEKYEEITLCISIPTKQEHVRVYAVEKYKGNNPSMKYSESIYKAECTIRFNW